MADLNIGSMVVEVNGGGSPVLMVHGLGGNSNSFHTLMDALEKFRVIRPDLPGAGRSSFRPGLSSLVKMADLMKSVLTALGEKNCHLVGHSMGTLICQLIAVRFPSMVKSLTLFGPMLEPPIEARSALKERAEKIRKGGIAEVADIISSNSISPKSKSDNPVVSAFVRESILNQNPQGYATHCEALSKSKAVEHDLIQCPTLLVVGDADQVTSMEMARSLSTKIFNSRIEILKDVGHWPLIENSVKSKELLLEHINFIEGMKGE